MNSTPLFVRASSLCMHNSESVRRRMGRPGGGGRGMAALNSAGNQLVKLNFKKTEMIVCGKAICLQLATGRITHTQAHINTFTLNGTRRVTGCVFVCVRRNMAQDNHKNSKLINLEALTGPGAIGEQLLHLSTALIERFLRGSCSYLQPCLCHLCWFS